MPAKPASASRPSSASTRSREAYWLLPAVSSRAKQATAMNAAMMSQAARRITPPPACAAPKPAGETRCSWFLRYQMAPSMAPAAAMQSSSSTAPQMFPRT